MPELATTVPPKGIGNIRWADLAKGAILSCSAQILAMLDFWLNADHFPTYLEWQPYIKATIYFFVLYLLKNFGTNNVGQFLKADKPIVHVDKEQLQELKDKADTAPDLPPL